MPTIFTKTKTETFFGHFKNLTETKTQKVNFQETETAKTI